MKLGEEVSAQHLFLGDISGKLLRLDKRPGVRWMVIHTTMYGIVHCLTKESFALLKPKPVVRRIVRRRGQRSRPPVGTQQRVSWSPDAPPDLF